MINYQKRDFLEHMPDIKKYSAGLAKLNDQWDSISLLSEINCLGQLKDLLPNMNKIQKRFYELQNELIESLTDETLKKLEQKTASKAQVAVDILIRNLYERTADVGFLATDDNVRKFTELETINDTDRQSILIHLNEYVAKYSVYEEIIILDKNFNVLINLDSDNLIAGKRIDDPLLRKTINSSDSFVETYAASSLQPNKSKAHIFSSKILSEDSSQILGIICLCFKFENETEQIFKKLDIDYDGSVIMIIDDNNHVLATSDDNHVPVGIKMEAVSRNQNGVIYYRGIEYIAITVETKGYQGYFGLGWKGHVIIPLRLAFREKSIRTLDNFNSVLSDGLMNKADSFSKALHDIILKTQQINDSLKRIVFNGQIITKDDDANDEFLKLKPLLNTISKMGSDTSRLFATSVQDLFATVISASLRDVSFLASLSIDIMDRNLYERANDCRWWALNSTFRSVLTKNELSDNDHKKLTDILTYINSLYTVYSNLFLFNRNGEIIAVSNPDRKADIGKKLDNHYVISILNNSTASNYYVSNFEVSNLYDDRHTYIYGASITDIQNKQHTVGGIGIVFDSDFQFKSMLHDALSTKEGSFAVFTDRQGLIISSTRDDLKTGEQFNIPPQLFTVPNGELSSEIIIYENYYYAVGCAGSSSYREYKNSDEYKNDVLSFTFVRLADNGLTKTSTQKNQNFDQASLPLNANEKHIKLASFAVNKQLLALEYHCVLDVIDADQIVSFPNQNELIRGAIYYRKQYLAVVDLHAILGNTDKHTPASHVLIVQLNDNNLVALEADELHQVAEVNESDIKDLPTIQKCDSVIKGIISFDHGNDQFILLLLNLDNLLNKSELRDIKLDLDQIIESTKNNVTKD